MSASSADIAVIVVNYGTADLAIAAVESGLARDHGGRKVEVLLVDNASPGDDATRIAAAHADRGWGTTVTFYPEPVNHGFGRGNNVVLAALAKRPAPPRYVFLLNPDARLENETIGILADVLDAHADVAIAGAAIRRDGTDALVPAAFRFPSLLSELDSAIAFGPVSRLLGSPAVALQPGGPTGPVDWVSGAAFLARFDVLKRVGFFDPRYFLYYEEVDLMRRVTAEGHAIWHVAEAVVAHAAGAATGLRGGERRTAALPAYWFDSWRIYYSAHYGRAGALGVALARLSGVGVNTVLSAFRRRSRAAPPGFGRMFARRVVLPLLGGGAHG